MMEKQASLLTSSISKASRILIAGGGIGGLALALSLQQRGFRPQIFERAPELKEIGAGLLLSPNGVHALERLNLREKATARGRIISEWRILDRSGRCLQRLRPSGGAPALSLHRADLQFLFKAELFADALCLGRAVRDFTLDAQGVKVTFESGATLRGDALVGADGLHSVVRAHRFGKKAPTYSGYVGWRGVSPSTPPEYLKSHDLSESWGEGKRFGISPLGNGRCYWYATLNSPARTSEECADPHRDLLALFGHWHAPIPALIESTPAAQIVPSNIFDRTAQHPWSDGAVTLLGDAAHPMTPNLGQGACLALEDACVLSECIATSTDFLSAFRHYEKRRSARVDWIQRASRLLGKVIQLESPAATSTRDVFLRLTPNFFADLSMRPLFAFKS